MKMRRSTEQAELILRLYKLRRETVMREARSFVGGAFAPKSAEELVEMVKKGGKEDLCCRCTDIGTWCARLCCAGC